MDAEVLFKASDRVPLPDDLRVPLEASSPALPAGAFPFDPLSSVSRAWPWALRLFILHSLYPSVGPEIYVLLRTLNFC